MLKIYAFLILAIGLLVSNPSICQVSLDFEKKVKEIHIKALTVDTHCDTPMNMISDGFNVGVRHTLPQSRVDFPRMKEGGLDAMFFAAFTGQRPTTKENTEVAYNLVNQMIDSIYAACKKYYDLAEVAIKTSDAQRLEKLGKRAIFIGMENGFPIGTKLNRVKEFYDRGVRYVTLCHSSNNKICDSSTDKVGPEYNGLSRFGEKVVRKMNKLGMMVDVSHISDKSFYDVIALSKAPVIASHSSVRAIAHHPRNLTNDMIKKLAAKGGVMQICLLDDYIKDPDTTSFRFQKEKEMRTIFNTTYDSMSDEQKSEARKQRGELREKYPKVLPTVADLVDHIDYVKDLVGIDYVGIGSDFDGGGGLDGCADVSEFPNITREMLKRGYTEEEIIKVWGGNFFRVFNEVEKVAGKN